MLVFLPPNMYTQTQHTTHVYFRLVILLLAMHSIHPMHMHTLLLSMHNRVICIRARISLLEVTKTRNFQRR